MSSSFQNNYGVVLLAAGKSSRLGQAKQLLDFKGKSLIKRAASTALEISGKLIVVTGAQEEQVKEELTGLNVFICSNKNYEQGIASSIHAGLITVHEKFPHINAVIFVVCDQPFISISLLKELIEVSELENKGIAASAYGGTFGTPVLFQKKYFSNLLQLKGDQGAKRIIQNNMGDVAIVDFPEGIMDIDTMEDYEALGNLPYT
jgi:molybdenum cofactor cytidylyltransferase